MANGRFDLDALFQRTRAAQSRAPRLLFSPPAGHVSPVQPLAQPWSTAAGDELLQTRIDLEVIDQVDGRFVLRPAVVVANDEQTFAYQSLSANDPVSIELNSGSGSIEKDPYTGAFLLTPRGDVPITGRAILDAALRGGDVDLVGQVGELGWSTTNIPVEEQVFDRSGGGACRSVAVMGGQEYEFELRVRAHMPANVIPLSQTHREIYWRHSLYFAHDPRIGLMRLYNNPEYRSKTTMISQGQNNSFFPATGQNELYFVMELLDMGYRCFNKAPMVQPFSNVQWPPYAVPLSIREPVKFFDVEQPDRLVLTVLKNDMQIYDYRGFEVELIRWILTDDGQVDSEWQIRNEAPEPLLVRWFFLGDFPKSPLINDQGNRLLGAKGSPNDSLKVTFRAPVTKSLLTQFVSLNVVSLMDPVMTGSKVRRFRFPEPGAVATGSASIE